MKTPSPTHHINNNRFLRLIAGALLLAAPFAVQAQTDYSVTLNTTYTWDTAPWSPSGIPGAGDTITDITSDGATARNLYLNSDREVENLTIAGLNGSGAIRLYNNNAGTSNITLDISNAFTAKQYTALRSLNPDGRLTVNTKDLVIDSSAKTARFLIAEAANYVNVKLAVSGTTTLKGGNSAIEVQSHATSATQIDLGHVVFDNTLSGGSPGIEIVTGAVSVRSLADGGINGTIRGAGTLLIYGDGPASNTFDSSITGGVRVEKTGSNIQILTRNNSYTGGTLISGGVLSANNTDVSGSILGRGAVTVANHGTLAGSGAIILGAGNYTTVQSGGTIAPGAHGLSGFSTLILNNFNKTDSGQSLLKMEEGSAFTFKIDDGGDSDSIIFAYYNEGSVLLEGGQITLNITGTLAEGYVYKLFTFRSGGALTGPLVSSGLTGGLVAGSGFDGYNATFHYDEDGFGGLGIISLTVEAIPEPSTAMLVLLPLAAALLRRRRRTNC